MGKSSRRTRQIPAVAAPKSPAVASVQVILTIALAVTPLCLLNGTFLSHDVMPKIIVTFACAALLLALSPWWIPGIHRLWNEPAGKVYLILVSVQAVSLLLSAAASVQPWLSLTGTLWRRFGAVEQIAVLAIGAAAAATTALHRDWLSTLFRATSLSGALASVYAIFQYFGVDPFLDPSLYKLEMFGSVARPPATMGHAIYLAAWLVPVACIAASSAWTDASPAWRWLHTGAAALACAAIFLSGTRGALIAVVVAAAFFAVRSGAASSARARRRSLAVAAIIIAVIAGFTLSPAGKGMRSRLVQWREDLGGPRLAVWLESPALIEKNPLFGSGPDTFAGEFRRIESINLSRAYPDFYHETPHNALIDSASAQGIPGVLILSGLFLLGSGVWPRRDPANRIAIAGLEAAILGIFVSSLFASFTIVESAYLWSLTGICSALRIAELKQIPRMLPAWWPVPAMLLAATFLFTALVLSVPDAIYSGLADAVAHRDLARASRIQASASSWKLGLPLPGYDLFASRQFATLARELAGTPGESKAWSEAAQAAAVAETSGEEKFSAAFQSSVLAISTGDLKRAESEARAAIALAPNWYRPHLFLGKILEATGRTGEGLAEQQLSTRLGAKSQ
jgi:O-antigen ligase